jgi:hypothetical protein
VRSVSPGKYVNHASHAKAAVKVAVNAVVVALNAVMKQLPLTVTK